MRDSAWKRLQASSRAAALLAIVLARSAGAEEWWRFRGPDGAGKSQARGLPLHWSATENVAWRTELPGAGTSSPVVIGNRVYVTCYSGYAVDAEAPGDMNNLKRHLVCLDLNSGQVLWQRDYDPVLPEHEYSGEGAYHGYSSSTPVSDGRRLYVFFGKSGLFCFDLEGQTLWQADVGEGINGWGSGASPVLHEDLVIVNASVESGAIVAFKKESGELAWRAEGINAAWNTPMVVRATSGRLELVVSVEGRLIGLDPRGGTELWFAEGVHRYVCPSVVDGDGVVFAIGGGHTSLAVRAGGDGDVTSTCGVWRENRGSNVSSPIYSDGRLYWASDSGGIVVCQDAATGSTVYEARLDPPSGLIYASPILADGKLYYVSQRSGTYVVAAGPEFQLLAHNVFEDDDSRMNASPAVAGNRLLLRNDRHLYCIEPAEEAAGGG